MITSAARRVESEMPTENVVRVSIPYVVEFIRRRCRRVEWATFWDDGVVAIRNVTAEEAPIAYQIARGDNGSGVEFGIRLFDAKFWWPLFHTAAAVSVENYTDSVTNSGSWFLSMMNLSPASVDSARQTTAQFDRDMSVSRIQKSSKDERWAMANRVAGRTLFCEDVVYVDRGPPAFFGISYGPDGDPTLCLEIGSLRPQTLGASPRWLRGPSINRRNVAVCRSLVFRIEDIETESLALTKKGFCLKFSARAVARLDVNADLHPSEVCIDALMRSALAHRSIDTSRKIRARLNGAPFPTRDGIIDRSICRDMLHYLLLTCPPEEIRKKLGFEFEWIEEAVQRLDARYPPSLSAEDAQALPPCQ
jgi:hypothetical protein